MPPAQYLAVLMLFEKKMRDIGVDEISALITFHLAPLATRRDIAMLGLIHKTILGKGPTQFSAFSQCEEQYIRKLIDPRLPSVHEVSIRFSGHLQHASI
jgi:hypothetical protein